MLRDLAEQMIMKTKQGYIAILCGIVLLLCISDVYPVFAEEGIISFNTDNGYLYSVAENGITITGYKGIEKNLRIPNEIDGLPVIRIGMYAFLHNQSIWSAIIPESVLEIESYAFDDSTLRCVVLSDGLQKIGESAFARSDITSIYIPASVTTVGRCAFYSCSHLRSVYNNASDTILRDRMFFECSNLFDITLPDTIQIIEEEAFYFCISLEVINLPKSLEAIEDHAFYDCRMLDIAVNNNIHLGQGVFSIYDPNE